MSWTVHEDEYKRTGPNFQNFLHEVVDAEAQYWKPNRKYTKCLQVFSSHTEHSDSAIDKTENNSAWLNFNTPINSPAANSKFESPLLPSQLKLPHYASSPSLLLDSKFTALDRESFAIKPAAKLCSIPSHGDKSNPADPRKLHVSTLNSDTLLHEAVSLPYSDWLTPGGTKSQQPLVGGTSINAESLRGRVYETAKDQHGCRFLQRVLDNKSVPEVIDVIMQEVIPHVAELMADQYANFLIQKLFDMMPDDVRYKVALQAAPSISSIALTPHGTFSVQKMIETISTRDEIEIVREALRKDVVSLVMNAHGNHVIQKVLQRLDFEDKQFIYDAVASDCVSIAKNKQGCCVLQRCLEFASASQKTELIRCILKCCLQIVTDPFGNYVLQYVLQANDSRINDTIAVAFLPQLIDLCTNKFSSNVMEKVLRGASKPVQEMYINAMCSEEVATCLMKDDFGNYVLQTALTISTPAQVESLVLIIRPLMHLIRDAPYAKKLEGKINIVLRKNGICHSITDAESMTAKIHSSNEKFGRFNCNKSSLSPEFPPTPWTKS